MLKRISGSLWDMNTEIFRCLRRMPLWVQIWMGAILIPVNVAAIFFLGEPYALTIFILANAAMMIVGLMILQSKGTTKIMSAPHVVFRIVLIGFLGSLLFGGLQVSAGYTTYLWILLTINAIALALDCFATWDWFRGNREVM